MLNQNIETLTKQLEDVCQERAETLTRLEDINKSMMELIKSIHIAKEAALLTETGSNPFVVGNILRITNYVRGKIGKVGVVLKV